jgi:hypothetical protein
MKTSSFSFFVRSKTWKSIQSLKPRLILHLRRFWKVRNVYQCLDNEPAGLLFQKSPKDALDTLSEKMKLNNSIVLHQNDLSKYQRDTEIVNKIFTEINDKIIIVEIFAKKGEVKVEFSENMKYGIILENQTTSEVSYVDKETESESKIHYLIASKSTPYKVSVILYRPENFEKDDVLLNIYYSINYESSSQDIVTQNLEFTKVEDKVSVRQIFIYSSIVIAGIILLVFLFVLIRYLKKKQEKSKKKSRKKRRRKKKRKNKYFETNSNIQNDTQTAQFNDNL